MNYNTSKVYKAGEKVVYNGVAYIATKPTMGNSPTNTKFWDVFTDSVGIFEAVRGDRNVKADPYTNGKTYKIGDAVSYKGVVYRAEKLTTGKNPMDNPKNWSILWEQTKPMPVIPQEDDKPLTIQRVDDPIRPKDVAVMVVNQRGFDGKPGDKGDKGDTGPEGKQGEQGIEGKQGPKGEKGDKGDAGPQGPAGPSGISRSIFGGSSNKFKLSSAGDGVSLLSGVALPAAAKLKSLEAGTGITFDTTDTKIVINSSGGGGAVDSVNGQTGLVVLDADDIDDTSTTNKFVTAADLTKLGNLSGTNTGDVTVTDSSEIDFTLTGQNITASLVAGSIDETKLDTSVNASLDLADSALQSADIGVSVQAHSAVLDATTASFTTADETKLDGIEAGADVTDTANVTAAGALMDSEVTSLSGIKTLVVPNSTTITAAAATVLDDTTVADMVNTLGGTSSSGTGGLVRTTSPTLVTPLLGTPTSGTLTNCTGLPIVAGTTGTLTETRGGTNQTSYTLGDLLYSSATDTLAKLTGNITATKKFLTQTGVVPEGTLATVRNYSLSQSTSQTNSTTIAKPTGLQVGDTMVITGGAWFCSGFAVSGWTQRYNSTSYCVFTKVADSSDVAASTFGISWSGFGERGFICVAFAGPCSVDVFNSATSTANAPSVTTTQNNCLLMLVGIAGNDGQTTNPASTTSVYTGNSGTTDNTYYGLNVATKAATTAGATGTNAFGASRAFTATIAITPVSGSPYSAAPEWDTIDAEDIPTLNQNTTGNAATVTVVDAASDTTTWPMLATSQTGNMSPATDADITYNASTNTLNVPNVYLGTNATYNAGGYIQAIQTGINEVKFNNAGVTLKNIYPSGGWARGFLTSTNSSDTIYFQFGGYGSGQTFTNAWIGPAYNDTWMTWNSTGVGIGTFADTPSAKLQIRATTKQLRLSYDASTNYGDFTVSSGGVLTIDATTSIALSKPITSGTWQGSNIGLAYGGTGASLTDPNADRLLFWDDSAGQMTWLTLGTNLSITGTTLDASGGSGGYATIQEEGSSLTQRDTINFVGAGITAADDAGNSRTNVTLDATLNALAGLSTAADKMITVTGTDTFSTETFKKSTTGAAVTYTDTASIAWTGTTAPSGTLTAQYTYETIGNYTFLTLTLAYSVAGSGLTRVICDVPSGLPTPLAIAGQGAANRMFTVGSGGMAPSLTSTIANNSKVYLYRNASNAVKLAVEGASGTHQVAFISIAYPS